MNQHNQKCLAGKWWFFPAIVTLAAVLLFRHVLFIGCVPSSSMEPTLPDGSFFLAVRVYESLGVGDIIVFQHDGTMMVKRIASMKVEQDKTGYYVMGDNADQSYDSRHWEKPFIERSEVIAKVLKEK